MRRSGIELLGQVPWGTHFCQFYENGEDLIEILAPYFREGLSSNEYCMWITSEPLAEDQVLTALRASIPMVNNYIEKGQLEIIDGARWYLCSGKFSPEEVLHEWLKKLRGAQKEGYEGLRLAVNTFWLDQAGRKSFKQYEEAIDRLIVDNPILALCTYSLRKCTAMEVIDLLETHDFSLIKREGRWQSIQTSEQNRAQTALEEAILQKDESLACLNAIFDSTPIGLGFWDKDLRFVRLNQALAEINGHSIAEHLGKRVDEIIPRVGEPDQLVNSWRQILEGGEPLVNVEISGETDADPGRIRYWMASWFPVKSRGEIIGLAATVRDITERKRWESDLQKRNELLQNRVEKGSVALKSTTEMLETIVDNIPAMLCVYDSDGHIKRINKEFARVMRCSPEEVKGINFFSLCGIRTVPSDSLALDKEDGLSGWQEFNIVTQEGVRFESSWASVRLSDGSHVGIGFDLRDLKIAEKERVRLSAAVEQAGESIVVTDSRGIIEYVNPAFEKTNGFSKEEVLGKVYEDIVGTYAGENRFKETLEKTIRNEGSWSSWSGRVKRRKKDGTILELDLTLSPIRDQAGQVINFLAVARDVTSEMNLQEHIRRLQKIEALGTLAGGIAHDLNNILGPILMNVEMALIDTPEDSTIARSLQIVLEAATRGKELVKQILAFTAQKETEVKPISLAPIVKESLELMRATIPRTIDIRERIGGDAGKVLANASQIHQVLVNLCTNAAHAMKEKGGVLEVCLERVIMDTSARSRYLELRAGPYARLTVSDTGHGMSPEVRRRIFDPFFTTKKIGEGTGMGLAVVDGIVRSHGGAITVYSEVGEGSTFNVYLPEIERDEVQRMTKMEPIRGGKERILLIDDEEIQLRTILPLLERLGYHVSARNDSREALELFRDRSEEFDLVITDQTMPGMTGITLSEEMIRIRHDIPIILCTGFSQVVNGGKANAVGVKEFIMKPFSVRDLALMVRRVLDNKNHSQ